MKVLYLFGSIFSGLFAFFSGREIFTSKDTARRVASLLVSLYFLGTAALYVVEMVK